MHPIKSLEPVERERAGIVENGGVEHDREYAIVDEDGDYVNGKRTAAVHRIRSTFDDALETVALRAEGEPESAARTFHLEDDRDALEGWLSDHFGMSVRLVRNADGGFPDDTTRSGPTAISTATLEEVASWFDGIDAHGMRLRFRANLEVAGVPPFWEDRLVAGHDEYVAFRVGSVTCRGVNPCQRCVVPARDPWTGREHEGFRQTFVDRRTATFPDWADPTRFDHHYRLMVNTWIAESQWGDDVAVGDGVEVLGRRRLDGDG